MLTYRVDTSKKWDNDGVISFSANITVSIVTNEFSNPMEIQDIVGINNIKVMEKKDKSGWMAFMPSTPWSKEKPKTFPYVRVIQKEDYDNLMAFLATWADNQK